MAKHVLLVEDDRFLLAKYARELTDTSDLSVLTAGTITEAVAMASATPDLAAAVVDLNLNARDDERAAVGAERRDHDGYGLARWLRAQPSRARLPVLGFTSDVRAAADCDGWFRASGDPSRAVGVYDKFTQRALLRHHVLRLTGQPSPITLFLIHGHDPAFRDDAERYALQLFGGDARTVVLGEQPRHGHTWIEMFEAHADGASLAWVLASPDEWGCPFDWRGAAAEIRPRPNVLLEYGYVLGKFGRLSKRVYLFRRPGVQLGSDVNGVAYIDVPGAFTDTATNARAKTALAPWLLEHLPSP